MIVASQVVTPDKLVGQAARESKTQDKQVLRGSLTAGAAHHCATALHKDDANAQSQTTWLQSRLREVSSSFRDCSCFCSMFTYSAVLHRTVCEKPAAASCFVT